MGNYFGGSFGYMGGFGFFLMFIFWGLVIWAIIAGVKMLSSDHGHSSSDGSKEDEALKVLRERYAKGEIQKEEFEAKKKDLTM